MNTDTYHYFIEEAASLFRKYHQLSPAFLMRKFKIDYDVAREIMQDLGLATEITAEEYFAQHGNELQPKKEKS